MNRTWQVTVDLVTTEDVSAEEHITTAHAQVTTNEGKQVQGFGRARRNPADREVPEIGDELATARALRDLADRLLNATSDDLSAIEHHRVQLRR